MFLGFRPHFHDSVESCLGSKIKNDILLVEHLCLPGVQPLFRLKTKQHNLNARSIIQRKKDNSHVISKNFEHCQEHNMLIFLAQSTKAYQRLLLKMAEYNVQMRYIQGKMNVIADALSRVCCMEPPEEDQGVTLLEVNAITNTLPASLAKLDEI